MKRRSLIAIGAVVAVSLGAAGALTGDGPSKAAPAPVTSTRRTAAPLRPVTPALPATFTKPAKPADFNGDGYRDLVNPFRESGQEPWLVTVVYGSPGGPAPSRHQSIGPSIPGIPGNVQVGWRSASADFDRDGYADLAVDAMDAASIVIFYGSATGLSGRSVVLSGPRDASFLSLAAGDFDGIGGMDLVAWSKGSCWVFRDITTKPVTGTKIPVTGRTGSKISRGRWSPGDFAWVREDPVVADVNGDRRSDLMLIVETPAAEEDGEGEGFWNAELRRGTVKGLSTNAVGFGNDQVSGRTAPVAADVNGDGRADVIALAPESRTESSTIVIFLSTPGGFESGKQIKLPFAGYGIKQLAIGDTDGDGRADLAASASNARIAVLPGGKDGLDPTRARLFDKTTPGLPAAPGNDLRSFGHQLFLTDVNGDGKADLITETPQEKVPAQDRVFVLPGSDSGITIKGATVFGRADLK